MTHNSHLNRGFSTPESAYSATFTLEIYLTEETDHTLIHTFAIIDDENEGWYLIVMIYKKLTTKNIIV